MTTWTMSGSRLAWGIGCLAAATVLALACSDSTAPTASTPSGKTPPPTPFVVSSPVMGTSTVVYISLPPGAIPLGQSATIRDPRLGSTVSATIVNGGFDPVALPAAAGDSLVLSVLGSGATVPVSYTRMVPEGEPPIVVRTSPTPHKRDVPLNARMEVVFSQPIDSATLAPGSIQLSRQSVPVPGHLVFGDPLHLTVAFTPDSALSPLTDYQLTVTAADGAPLTTPVQVPFTTGTSSLVGRLAFVVQPTQVTAGKVMSPAVQVIALNAAGTDAMYYPGPITIALGPRRFVGGVLSGGLQQSAASGLATFPDLSIDMVNPAPDSNGARLYTLTASAPGFTGATSSGFAVVAGTVGTLAFVVQPGQGTDGPGVPPTVTAGMAMSPAIQVMVLNAAGVRDSTYTGPITIAIGRDAGGGTLSGRLQVPAANGLATFPDLSVDKTNQYHDAYSLMLYTLAASAAGFAGDTSSGFFVQGGVATTLSLEWQPSDALAGLTMWVPVRVVARDPEGNATQGPDALLTVALGSNPAGGTLSGTTATWAVNINAFQFGDLRIDRPGSGYTLVVTYGGLTTTSTPFTVFQPSQLIAFAGSVPGRGSELGFVDAMSGGMARGDSGAVNGVSWPAWSPDGMKIALNGNPNAGNATLGEEFGPIEVMNADGSGLVSLGQSGDRPAWSPDGSRIAFGGTGGICVMNADGTGVTQVGPPGSRAPAWSPDGTMIAFSMGDIYVMKADGTAVTRLTDGLGGMWPVWSPDGTRIAFGTGTAGIYVMNADGSSVTLVTGPGVASSGVNNLAPSWSPDGTTLAFSGKVGNDMTDRIYVVSLDGTGLRPLTGLLLDGSGGVYSTGYYGNQFDFEPAWRPVPHP